MRGAGQIIDSPESVANAFSHLKYATKEHFLVANLNNRHEIVSYEVVAIGSVNSI
ncbi:JAB domain-containing protein [Sessilibacter corallicola]|uniref:JAB domain-containing protein n=1 Tax=Sessilibacter corallicola TaxID=2904075 RepID=UPI003341CED3